VLTLGTEGGGSYVFRGTMTVAPRADDEDAPVSCVLFVCEDGTCRIERTDAVGGGLRFQRGESNNK
jgi:hypothetical protein